MTFLVQMIIHTPPWVWALLALVLWLGWRDLRDRVIAPARLVALPAISTGMSVVGVLTSTAPALSAAVWLLAITAGAPLGVLIATRRRIAVEPTRGQLRLTGSWFSMILGLAIFAIRYAMGVATARDPALTLDAGWIVASAAVGGAVSGIGLGWLVCLLLRSRRALRAADDGPAAASPIAAH